MVELITDVPQAVKNDTDTAQSLDVDGAPLCGIVHLDSCDDIDLGGSDSCPIMCLPVIDTRGHQKHALHEDVTSTFNGVTGLLLVPADIGSARFRGFYKRVGVFSLVGEKQVRLRVRPGPEDILEHFFRAKTEDESEEYIILT
jgi:hypothetical protein